MTDICFICFRAFITLFDYQNDLSLMQMNTLYSLGAGHDDLKPSFLRSVQTDDAALDSMLLATPR